MLFLGRKLESEPREAAASGSLLDAPDNFLAGTVAACPRRAALASFFADTLLE
jgi:hypothetical protein